MNGTFQGEVTIETESDIVVVRRTVREAAAERGFNTTEVTRIVTASSELARNIFKYAGSGVMRWRSIEKSDSTGIELQFIDRGPGIENLDLAMQEGYSSSGGLGMGLPGTKRLVDELDIQSVVGKGTTVILKKWRKN